MKKIWFVCLAFCVCLWPARSGAQMPMFRNAFTTNVPGAYVRGNMDFGTGLNWFRVNGAFTNLSGNAHFHGGTTYFDDGLNVALPSLFRDQVTISNLALVYGQIGIRTNSTVADLHIAGSGVRTNAIVVGNNHYGDYRFLVTTNGDVIVNLNTAAPERSLPGTTGVSVRGQDNMNARLGVSTYGTGYGAFASRHAGRTCLNKTNTPSGSTLIALEGWGYLETAYASASSVSIKGFAQDTWWNTNTPTYLAFYTCPTASTNEVERMRISHTGAVGIATNSPQVTFEVHGGIRATNILVSPAQWDDVRIPMQSLTSPSSAPGREAFVGNCYAYAFDKASDEQLTFELQIPHGIDTNNVYGIRIHIHWSGLTAPGATSNVVWGLEYVVANPLQTFPATSITNFVTNGLASVRQHQIASFRTITNCTESAVLSGRIFRDADNGTDDYDGDAFGLSLDAHYPRVRFGSTKEMGDY